MTESPWKVIVDGDHLTISSDAFTFTTTGTDPTRLEGVIADLQSALRGTYGQFCGVSMAAEMVGERWGFHIIRDLITGPKSVAELNVGLPRLSPALLSKRLKELEFVGVVRQVEATAHDDEPDRYELTAYGRAAENAVLEFGRWGALALTLPRHDDIVTESSLLVALKATFLSEVAGDSRLDYELHVGGCVVNVRIREGALEVASGPLPGADAILDLGSVLLDLWTGQQSAAEVLATGQVLVDGDPALLNRFVEMFQLPRLPAPERATPKVPA
jgi:DNA-binding HxlR family transcriptional regulator/putative sterol carrier protein